MQGQADAGEGRLQLVTDRRDEVTLDSIEQAEAGDILKQNGGAESIAVGIADRQDLRQQAVLLTIHAQCNRLLKSLGQERALLLQGVL